MASLSSLASARGLISRANRLGDGSEKHCLCADCKGAHGPSPAGEACGCLQQCQGGCKNVSRSARDLVEAALVISGGSYPVAYTALARALGERTTVDSRPWPQAAKDALAIVDEKCSKVNYASVTSQQLCLAALVIDERCSAAYDRLAFLTEARPTVSVKLPDGRGLNSNGLWREKIACDVAEAASRLSAIDSSSASSPRRQNTGALGSPPTPPSGGPRLPKAVQRAMSYLSQLSPRCEWTTPEVLAALTATATDEWVLATAAGLPAPKATGLWCGPLQEAARLLQEGQSAAGFDAAQAVASGEGLGAQPPAVAVAGQLYCALAFLDLDTPRADPAHRDVLQPCTYLGDAVEALHKYQDAVQDGAVEFDAAYLLAAALVELQRAQSGGNMSDATGLLDAFGALHPSRRGAPPPPAGATQLPGWRGVVDASNIAVISKQQSDEHPPKDARELWEELQAQMPQNGRQYTAMQGLMQYVGLEKIKQAALALIRGVLAQQSGFPLPSNFLNYTFVGNPGTGKTEVSKLWARLLGELGLRPSDEDEASKAAQASADAAAQRASETQTEKLDCELRTKLAALDLGNARRDEAMWTRVVSGLKDAPDMLASLQAQVGNLKVEVPSETYKKSIAQNASTNASSLQAKLRDAERELERARASVTRLEAEASGASAAHQTAAAAAAAAAAGAATAAQGVVKRYVELDGATLASGKVDGKEGVELLDSLVMPLLDPALKVKGGIIFVDEAQNLDCFARPKGLDVIRRIVKLSDMYKKELTFIFAGYEKDIENKVFKADNGLFRRFPNKIVFDDYTAPELARILYGMVSDPPPPDGQGLAPANNGVRYSIERRTTEAFGRRVARGAGMRGFGNAGLVKTRLTGPIMDRWRMRVIPDPSHPPSPTAANMALTLEDVMGPRPDTRTGLVGAVMHKINKMTGLKEVKRAFAALVERMGEMYDVDCDPDSSSVSLNAGLLNRVFMGGPGTGKTTVARLYAALLKACDFISDGEVVEVKPANMLGDAVGVGITNTQALLERCRGKVLFIDEAYGLFENKSFGPEVITTLVGDMPDKAGADMAVIIAGYADEMKAMLENANPGLSRRFPAPHCRFEFANFDRAELRVTVMSAASSLGLRLSFAAADAAAVQLSREAQLRNFGNADACVKFAERLQLSVGRRKKEDSSADSSVSEEDVRHMLEEEHGTDPTTGFGLPPLLREYVESAAALVRLHAARRLPPPPLRHIRLLAPSGSGKTTCAKVLARELYLAGVLAKKEPVCRDAESLPAGFVNQSAGKMLAVLKEAQGGLLFIDEAHRLRSGGMGGAADFKAETLGTLIAALGSPESPFYGKLLVVIAGYPTAMREMLDADLGLSSRFPVEIELGDVPAAVCVDAVEAKLRQRAASSGVRGAPPALEGDARQALLAYFEERRVLTNFGNLREADLFFDALQEAGVVRLRAQALLNAPDMADAKQRAAHVSAELDGLLRQWNSYPTIDDVRAVCTAQITAARAATAAVRARAASDAANLGRWGARPAFESAGGHEAGQRHAVKTNVFSKADAGAKEDGDAQEAPKAASYSAAEKAVLALADGIFGEAARQAGQDAAAIDALVALADGQPSAAAQRERMLGELKARARAAGSPLSDAAVDAMLSAFLANTSDMIDKSQGDAALAEEKRQNRRLREQATGSEAMALDARMREMCETEEVTTSRNCGICGRADDPYSGCAYGGNSPSPQYIKNITRHRTYAQV